MSGDGILQKLHSKVDVEIVKLLLSVIPNSWYSIRLEVEYTIMENGHEGFPMNISNNEGKCDIVIPPDELYSKICEHSNIFKQYGKQWKKLTYNVFFDTDKEDWEFKIDYEY